MRNARAVLFFSVIAIFVATAAVTLLGIVGVILVPEAYLKPLFGALLLELVAAVIGLFKGTDWFGHDRSDGGLEAIRGGWWELLRGQQVNALAFVRIGYSAERQQVVLEGDAFTADGQRYARWWSIAASLNPSTRELYYFWEGDHMEEHSDFSGVGFFRFEDSAGDEQTNRGDGWFTAGNLDELAVTGRRKVELMRASEDDARVVLSANPAARRERAAAIYAAWRPAGQAPVPVDR